jgi:hypothetical protein
MAPLPGQSDLDSETDDDGVFVPIADLFSLLSLTVIYTVLTFGQTVPVTTEVEHVVQATLEGSGPGKPIDPRDVYLTFGVGQGGIVFYLTRNGTTSTQAIPFEGASAKVPEEWILATIARLGPPPTLYLYLAPTDNLALKALFTDTQRFLGANYRNVQVAL